MTSVIWEKCLPSLQQELSIQHFNTWIRPLVVDNDTQENEFCLLAPNRFILDWVNNKFLSRINELVLETYIEQKLSPPNHVSLKVSSHLQPAFKSRATKKREADHYTQTGKPVEPSVSLASPTYHGREHSNTQGHAETNSPSFRDDFTQEITRSNQEVAGSNNVSREPFGFPEEPSKAPAQQEPHRGDIYSGVHEQSTDVESLRAEVDKLSENELSTVDAPNADTRHSFDETASFGGITSNTLAGNHTPNQSAPFLSAPFPSEPFSAESASARSSGGRPSEVPPVDNVFAAANTAARSTSNGPIDGSLLSASQSTPQNPPHKPQAKQAYHNELSPPPHTPSDMGQQLPLAERSRQAPSTPTAVPKPEMFISHGAGGGGQDRSGLNKAFTFESFVEGKSNQMGLAAAQQVVENPGGSYNPLFIYGGVGLGKTHLMHAVGNEMAKRNPNAKIVYLHSERFVADMVKALQLNAINDFKRYYRSVDALLIDDIQFFAGKDRSQEEFFHTFNALLEGNQQIILTCDRYPKVINNLEERLKSRFGWGLTIEVEPPELETRAAILLKRAEEIGVELSYDAAFFIAQRIRSNVRELEGALKRVIANASFTHRSITVELVREALKDLLALQDKQVSISNIQKVVGEYYKVKISDFLSKRRSRSVARPRQVAMSLAKELTNHSLPEIGDAFGGRDHTTVLHACRKIKELCETDNEIQQDMRNLQRLLTT